MARTLKKALVQQWGVEYRKSRHYNEMLQTFKALWGERFWRDPEYREMVVGGITAGRWLSYILSDVSNRLAYEQRNRTGTNKPKPKDPSTEACGW
jgi:hypothetical protein